MRLFISVSLLFLALAACVGSTLQSLERLNFEELPYGRKSLSELPFLADSKIFVEREGETKAGKDDAPKTLHAVLNAGDRKIHLILFHGIGCGMHGCPLKFYESHGGKEYERINMNLIANEPIYSFSCGLDYYLITTGGGGTSSGYARWKLLDKNIEYIGKFQTVSQAARC